MTWRWGHTSLRKWRGTRFDGLCTRGNESALVGQTGRSGHTESACYERDLTDVTLVNVALPSIQDDLGFSTSSLAWVVNAYLIAFGGLLLLAGRLGDLIGRRTVFLSGMGLFTGASLLCGLARSQELLIGARF